MKQLLFYFLTTTSLPIISMHEGRLPIIPQQQVLFVLAAVAANNELPVKLQRSKRVKAQHTQCTQEPKHQKIRLTKKNYPIQQPKSRRKGHQW